MYLKQLAFYTLQLKYLGIKNNSTEDIILNTLSGLMSNLETGNKQFYNTLINLKTIIIESIDIYNRTCYERDIKPKEIETNLKLNRKLDITELIRLGEKEFSKKLKSISDEKRTIFEILFLVLKSICINLVELKSFNLSDNCVYSEILYLLNTLNFPEISNRLLIKKINLGVKINSNLTKKLYQIRKENYGEQTEATVSYSTYPSKAILVAGTNLQELKKVLDAVKDLDIDVYTHGDMIIAYTYPFFRKYKNLKGQFGKGIDSCLLDFATFPGSILIAKHSLENIEYLYRGRLFTTDNFVPQGVVQICNDDYSQLISSALSAKGFKTGKEREKINIGCSEECLKSELDKIIDNLQNYKKIIIFTTKEYSNEQREFFKKLTKSIKPDEFLISLAEEYNIKNCINIKSAPDFYMVYRIMEYLLPHLKKYNINLSVYISKCDKHTISNVIRLKQIGADNIYLSKCAPIMLNPSLTNSLKNLYGILPANL